MMLKGGDRWLGKGFGGLQTRKVEQMSEGW